LKRKKWTPQTSVTPSLLKFREKRKWQISLRRYVLENSPCQSYAPYFGLDKLSMRKWFELQFVQDLNWGNFAKSWQFDHIVPVTYFDQSKNEELKLCWNFTNLRVDDLKKNKNWGNRLDIIAAKEYFESLRSKTSYNICEKMIEKIKNIEISSLESSKAQQVFILENHNYIELIEDYSAFEFELLNSGRSINDVKKEVDFFRTIK
jgi:hypothetical protein